MKTEDRIGTVINGWKIIEITGKDKYNRTLFKIISEITNKVIINARLTVIQKNKYSHKERQPYYPCLNYRLRRIFYGMKERCFNLKNNSYNSYGKRGISIYQEWLNNPRSFEEWALENGYQEGLTIDRIDLNGNYEPSNCRWISNEENAKWHRNTQHIWIQNYVDSASGWSLKIGKNRDWFNCLKRRHGYNYAYQCLLEEIEKLGSIKKVMGINEEHDISQFLKDIENDCLEVD